MVGKIPVLQKEKLIGWNNFSSTILHPVLPTPDSNLALQYRFWSYKGLQWIRYIYQVLWWNLQCESKLFYFPHLWEDIF